MSRILNEFHQLSRCLAAHLCVKLFIFIFMICLGFYRGFQKNCVLSQSTNSRLKASDLSQEIFTDRDINYIKTLVDILICSNLMLSHQYLRSQAAAAAKKQDIGETSFSRLYSIFLDNVKNNLHIVLAMSPLGGYLTYLFACLNYCYT